MKSSLRNIRLLHISTALIFAAVTLIVVFILGNFEHKDMVLLLMLGLYFIPVVIIEKLKPTDEPPQD